MGLLVAKKYPTKLFLNAADHTYVECGTGGKGWGCWGGKSNGTAFNSATGSTSRADAIATPDEKAGIKCYLVNGVCHQAANRVLLPAGILVAAARGYGVSSAIFGTYGKVGFWPCSSPFLQNPGVTGDLPECVSGRGSYDDEAALDLIQPISTEEQNFIQLILELYSTFNSSSTEDEEAYDFSIRLFEEEVRFRLGDNIGPAEQGLLEAKQLIENRHRSLIEGLQNEMPAAEFIRGFNDITLAFQESVATALDRSQYETLMNTSPDEPIVLADPDIIRVMYDDEVVREVYGNI